MNGLRLRCDSDPQWAGRCLNIRITTHGQPGDKILFNQDMLDPGMECIGVEFKYRKATDPSMELPVAIRLQEKVTQQLMDEMWACGIRPSNGEGNIGELNATSCHLNDMRKIAFNLLKI